MATGKLLQAEGFQGFVHSKEVGLGKSPQCTSMRIASHLNEATDGERKVPVDLLSLRKVSDLMATLPNHRRVAPEDRPGRGGNETSD